MLHLYKQMQNVYLAILYIIHNARDKSHVTITTYHVYLEYLM
jgi:hypothetical protein